MKKLLLTTLIIVANSTSIFSQVGIGTTNPSASSALDINSTNSGLLIPRITLTSTTDVVTIPNPATSLLVYNTATLSDVVPGFYFWDTKWNLLQDSNLSTHLKKYGEVFRTSNTTLASSNDIPFNSNGPSSGVILSTTNIKVTTAGDYKVSYTINFSRNSNNGDHTFHLRKNNVKIVGSSIFETAYNAEQNSTTKTKLIALAAGDTVSIYYETGDSITLFEGTSLSVELVK